MSVTSLISLTIICIKHCFLGIFEIHCFSFMNIHKTMCRTVEFSTIIQFNCFAF